MTLDLHDLTADWDYQAGEICARMVDGRDGAELLQLRVDLGVMQMFPDGRPDGERYRGLPTALAYFQHESRLGRDDFEPADWREFERELHQINYRRLALSSLVEDCLRRDDINAARALLRRALRDVEACREHVWLAAGHPACPFRRSAQALRPTLMFHRGRLRVQFRVIDGLYEQAVEEAEQAQQELDALLAELGLDEEQREDDPGVVFLRDLGRELRRDYDVSMTLSERLEEALENEEFETAARLRDELRHRQDAQSAENTSPDAQ